MIPRVSFPLPSDRPLVRLWRRVWKAGRSRRKTAILEISPREAAALRYAPWPSPPSCRIDSTEALPVGRNPRRTPVCKRRRFSPRSPSPSRSRAFSCHNYGGSVYTRGEALHNAYRGRRVGGMWSDEGERWKGTFYGRDSTNLVVNSSDRGSFAVFYGLRLEGWSPVARGVV